MLVPSAFSVEITVGPAVNPTVPDAAELGPVPLELFATTVNE